MIARIIAVVLSVIVYLSLVTLGKEYFYIPGDMLSAISIVAVAAGASIYISTTFFKLITRRK